MKETCTYTATAFRLPLTKRSLLLCLLFIMAQCFVAFLTTNVTHAESFTVTAKVPAPIPSLPVIITSPDDQQEFTTADVTVRGICPPEATYVIVFRNTISSGTAPCSSGEFSLGISLVKGENHLQAIAYNSTDDPGPVDTGIVVFYKPPQPTPFPESPFPIPLFPSVTPSVVNPSRITPLTLEYHYAYRVRNMGQEWQWDISLQGGVAPYMCSVDWGDGQHETLDPTADHLLALRHIYKEAGTYTPRVTCRDRAGTEAILQLLAVVNPAAIDETNTNLQTKHNQSDDAIPSYVIVGAPVGAVLIAALVHAFVAQGKLPRLPKLPKKSR